MYCPCAELVQHMLLAPTAVIFFFFPEGYFLWCVLIRGHWHSFHRKKAWTPCYNAWYRKIVDMPFCTMKWSSLDVNSILQATALSSSRRKTRQSGIENDQNQLKEWWSFLSIKFCCPFKGSTRDNCIYPLWTSFVYWYSGNTKIMPSTYAISLSFPSKMNIFSSETIIELGFFLLEEGKSL